MKKYYAEIMLLVALLAMTVVVAVLSQERQDALNKVTALTAANAAVTKEVRAARVDGFRDGLDTCTNEDIAYFNDMAVEIPELVKLMEAWALNWAYDEDTTNVMVEQYMEEATN